MTGFNMKSGVLALAAAATLAIAVSPANAQWRHHTRSYDGGDFNTGQKVAIIGGGAAAGAVIGGLLGGTKGAIIGGAVGGGAGTIAVVAKEESEHHYRGYRGGYGYGGGPYYGGRFSQGYYESGRGPGWGDRWRDRGDRWRDVHRGDRVGQWRGGDRAEDRFNRVGRDRH